MRALRKLLSGGVRVYGPVTAKLIDGRVVRNGEAVSSGPATHLDCEYQGETIFVLLDDDELDLILLSVVHDELEVTGEIWDGTVLL